MSSPPERAAGSAESAEERGRPIEGVLEDRFEGVAEAGIRDELRVREERDASPEQVCAELVQAGIGVRGFAVASPSLEDLFVGLTGEGFDVSG